MPLAVTTSTGGAYTTSATLPEGTQTLRASWSGDATHEPATSPEATLVILPRTGAIKVSIVDEKGTPIQGATVQTIANPIGQTPTQATTSTDGTTTLTNLRTGQYTVNATMQGYKPNTGTCQVTDDQTTTLQIAMKKIDNEVPEYPELSIVTGLIIILGYCIIYKTQKREGSVLNL